MAAIKAADPAVVLFAGSPDGRDLAAACAARLGVGVLVDVTGLEVKDGRVTATHPCFGGGIIAEKEAVGFRRLQIASPISTPASTRTHVPAFGPYLGFASAFGYWASACVGNVSYWVLIKSTLGAVFPFFGDGNTVSAIAVSSIGIWAFHFLVLRGTKEAAAINKIVTIAKVIPLLLVPRAGHLCVQDRCFRREPLGRW